MKQLIFGAVLTVSTFFATAPHAQADQWGCTIFLCFASPTNPMAIGDCATAILKIRPWKKPSCSAVKVHYQRDVTRMCPRGYEYFEGEGDFDLRKSSNQQMSKFETSISGEEKFFGLEDMCIEPRTGTVLTPKQYTVYEALYSAGGEQYSIDYIYP